MKKKFLFKSIYFKFVTIFIGIWWLFNSITFFVIAFIMSRSILAKYSKKLYQFAFEFRRIRRLTVIIFIVSAVLGSLLILIAIRGVVKPIKRLSDASRIVAKGNFDIEVEVPGIDELGQLTADFNLMTKELKNIDVLRKDFVSNVSHEFKTPITSIKGYARLIKEGGLSDKQLKEYSEIILNESMRLSLLSSNLLKLSELDSKIIREQAGLFSLDEQIRKAILLLEVEWEKKELELDINLEEIMITADEALLQEVWLNLIQNAVKFSNQGGSITIDLYKGDNRAVFRIKDNGIGIAESDKARIFERFYKGDRSRSGEGNGLGLVIVKRIVELMNGIITFESEPGKGTVFIVELPLAAGNDRA